MKQNTSVSLLLAISWCLFSTSVAAASVPHLIRYQGQAVDTQGVPVEGPHTLTFRLYDAATAGTTIWEEIQPNVPITGGFFSVLLGQVTPLNPDWSQPLWLSVQVDADPEFTPRQPLTSVPLALRAENAEQLTQPLTPSLIAPQGSGSNLDADTVDGQHANNLLSRFTHTGTQTPSTISPQGSGSGLDADMVDGKHAADFAAAGHTHSFTSQNCQWTSQMCHTADPPGTVGPTIECVSGYYQKGIQASSQLVSCKAGWCIAQCVSIQCCQP